MIALIIVLGVVFLVMMSLVMKAVAVYNGLVQLRTQSDGAWADIDVQLKRRYDLIPNLVATVEGYAAHERNTLQAVIDARAKAMGATSVEQKAQAENFLAGTLKSLFALAENYPQLRANENFLGLQKSLTEIEETVQAARRYYNAVVRDYNTRTQVFPDNIFAGMFNFKTRDFFQLGSEEERKAPQVKF
jgi:LemA protein